MEYQVQMKGKEDWVFSETFKPLAGFFTVMPNLWVFPLPFLCELKKHMNDINIFLSITYFYINNFYPLRIWIRPSTGEELLPLLPSSMTLSSGAPFSNLVFATNRSLSVVVSANRVYGYQQSSTPLSYVCVTCCNQKIQFYYL